MSFKIKVYRNNSRKCSEIYTEFTKEIAFKKYLSVITSKLTLQEDTRVQLEERIYSESKCKVNTISIFKIKKCHEL